MIHSELLGRVPGIDHGFSTLATPPAKNRELDGKVSTGQQVHRDGFLWPVQFERRKSEADAVGTTTPGFYVGVYSADCAPILLAAAGAGGTIQAVMAVHAGWRGSALGIAGKAISALLEKVPAKRIYAAIGPCIGFSSFEVGEDVISAFPHALNQGLAKPLRREDDKQKFLFNLAGENLRQLRESAENHSVDLQAEVLDQCTFRDPLYPSYRREKSGGRILSFIAFAAESPSAP